MKNILVALGLTLAVGCHDQKRQLVALPVTLQVENQGTTAAYGRAEDWDGFDVRDFTVEPGESVTVTVTSEFRVKLQVWRSSDDTLLFDDFWDVADASSPKPIRVTIYP